MSYIEDIYTKRYEVEEECRILLFNGLHEFYTTCDLDGSHVPFKEAGLRIIVSFDDIHRLPHCHVIRGYMETPSFHCCIRLDTNKYYRNNHGVEDRLSDEDLIIFNEFMLSMKNCPTQHLDPIKYQWSARYRNYKRIWNRPADISQFNELITNFPMPDYSVILEDDESTKILEEKLIRILISE